VVCFTANKLTNFLPWNKKKKKQQVEPGSSLQPSEQFSCEFKVLKKRSHFLIAHIIKTPTSVCMILSVTVTKRYRSSSVDWVHSLPVCLSVCLWVCLSACLPAFLSVCLSVCHTSTFTEIVSSVPG